jgi:WD40 repeat protein
MFRLPGLGSKKLKEPPARHGASLAVDFSRSRSHLAIGGPGLVKIWDWEADRDLPTLERHSSGVHSIAFDVRPGTLVTCDPVLAHV